MSIPGGIARLWRQLRNSGKRSRQVIVVARSRSPVVVVVNLVHLVWSCTMVEQSHHRAREQLLVELRVALRHQIVGEVSDHASPRGQAHRLTFSGMLPHPLQHVGQS
jgi:hypothetical protein